MPDKVDINVAFSPVTTALRLTQAAAAEPLVFGQRMEVRIDGGALRISPPPTDSDRPRAVSIGSIEAVGTGTRVQLWDAMPTTGARRAAVSIFSGP